MNDREYRAQKRRVRTVLNKWQGAVGLNSWRLSYGWDRTGAEFPRPNPNDGELGIVTLMRTKSDWRYKTATILCNIPEIVDIEDAALDEYGVHELMHIVVQEMHYDPEHDQQPLAHEERVVTELARAFLYVRDHADKLR